MARPQIFVGSSTESKPLAHAIQANLDDHADITVWDQNVFKLTKTNLESLLDRLNVSDYAIFIFSPDDLLKVRNQKFKSVRDNVIIELGLFMGRLGRDRTFVVHPKGGDHLRIPTDLAGITIGTYNAKRDDKNLEAALGPFCSNVAREITKLGVVKLRDKASERQKRRRTPKPKHLEIETAIYGKGQHWTDVSKQLNAAIRNDRLTIHVGNQIAGDPCPGIEKEIQVTYRYKNRRQSIALLELDTLKLPGRSLTEEV